LAYFTCPRPHLMAVVAEARPAGTDAEYEAALAFGKRIRNDTPTSDSVERSGTNRHHNPYWAYMGQARTERGPYYFGGSVTRVRDKAVVMMFEGQYRLSSEAGRAQEARAFRAQSELFLTSVK